MRHLILFAFVAACNFPVLDYVIDPDIADPTPVNQPDTCVDDTLYLLPEFKTSTFEIEQAVTYPLEFHIGPYVYIIAPQEHAALPGIIDSLFTLWHPEYTYRVHMKSTASRFALSVVVDGTNDHQAWQFQTYVRYQGVKHYFGWVRQSFMFGGACNEEEYNELINLYPSVNKFNFRATQYDSLDYIKFSYKILGECKEGRDRADFRWMPIAMPDSIVQLFIEAGWDNVLY